MLPNNNPDAVTRKIQLKDPNLSTTQELDASCIELVDTADTNESDQLLTESGETVENIRAAIEDTVESTLTIVKFTTPKIYSPENTPISKRIIQCNTPSGCIITVGSDKGVNYKNHNEDCVFINPEKELAVVIDGIGGGTKGRIAAQWVAMGFSDYPDSPEEAAKAAMGYMKRDKIDPNLDGACFASARIIDKGQRKILDMSKAGDVRIMILDENDKIFWVSTDNSFVQDEVRHGRLTPDQALYHKDSSTVTKYISSGLCSVERSAMQIFPGYKAVIGSDGFFGNITTQETEELIAGKGYSADQIITVLSGFVLERMKNFAEILANTNAVGGREKFGMFADGFLSTPSPDNRSMAIIEIPR